MSIRFGKSLGFSLLALAIGFTAGCRYTGADNPVARNFSWRSYLNADDIRAACQPGTPERWRLVYNAVYQEQVRAYEVDAGLPGGGARVTAKVGVAANFASLDIDPDNPDPFLPWRDKIGRTEIRAQDWTAFRAALAGAGALIPLETAMELDSDGFYWIVAGCAGGRMHFSAYSWPSPAWDGMGFDKLLFAWDFTGVPVNPPRKTTKFDLYGKTNPSPTEDRSFMVRVDGKGAR
jgi:hypothetical protein